MQNKDHDDHGAVPLIDLRAQHEALRDRIEARIRKVLEEARFILGPEVDELEKALADFTGASHAIAVASGTDALKIPLMAAGIGPGDAVFVPAFTFVATSEVVAVLGASPVFVDIDPLTLNMDPHHLHGQVKRTRSDGGLRPRAVIAVDLFGRPADYPGLIDCAASHGLLVIADAAQSFGASIGNRRVGTLAPVTATSFYPSKTLGGYGDGGCIFTDDSERAEMMRSIQRHGYDAGGPLVVNIGTNSRLDTLQAAVLLAKLEVFQDELEARQRIADIYSSELQGAVETPEPFNEGTRAWSIYPVLSDRRDRLHKALADEGIATGIYYATPLHLHPAYERYGEGPGSLPVSENVCKRILALPMHPYLDDPTVRRICRAITQEL